MTLGLYEPYIVGYSRDTMGTTEIKFEKFPQFGSKLGTQFREVGLNSNRVQNVAVNTALRSVHTARHSRGIALR